MFIYIKQNFYIEPRFEILEEYICDKHKVNSSGYWEYEQDGIMHYWIDISKCDHCPDPNILEIYNKYKLEYNINDILS